MQYFFEHSVYRDLFFYWKKKESKEKMSFSFYSSHLTTSFLTAYFRQQHYRTLLHMCRNKKEA